MNKDLKIKLIVALFVFLIIILICNRFLTKKHIDNSIENQTAALFEEINLSSNAKINKYIVYGTHFNLEGTIQIPKISDISIYSVHIIAKNIEGKETPIYCTYSYKDNILSFSTIDKINKGLSLENLSESNYYLFLKVIFSNSEEKLFSLENTSKYSDTTYYTITKKEKIDIKFGKHTNIPFMGLFVSKIDSLPNNVYDIAIDASHGGIDKGATYKKHNEAEIVLKYSKNLKQKLEALGYKVYISRDGSEISSANLSDVYAENGRINKIQDSHCKLLLSLNINDTSSKKGGVEIYAPTKCDLSFAKQLADNIVKTAKTSYSSAKLFKQDNGVYVRNFTEFDILSYKSSALLHKFEPYNITKSTPYQYMIREVGGIATEAFVDGRNTSYGKNKYFDSNVGIESYIIELGYMKYENDLNNILNNQDLYVQAILNSINENYGK